MDLRGAKSNVMSLFGTYRNRNCPLVALLGAWLLSRLHAGVGETLEIVLTHRLHLGGR